MADRTDYGRACAARARLETAIALLRSAHAEIGSITGVGAQHDCTRSASIAALEAQRTLARLEILIPRIST